MPVTLINGYVLLPDAPDWSSGVTWARGWQTGITTAVTGDETRQGVRALGRETLSWEILATTLQERAELDERLDAASKSGLACAPYWGRASTLADEVTGTTVTLTDSLWNWAVGDYIFLMDAFGNYEVGQVEDLQHPAPTADSTLVTADSTIFRADDSGPPTLTLAADVSRDYAAGLLAWPVLFGKFKMDKQSALTSWHGSVKVTLAELNARNQPAIGTVPKGGFGIGYMRIGTTFVIG